MIFFYVKQYFFKIKKTMTDTWRQDNRGRSLTTKGEIAFL